MAKTTRKWRDEWTTRVFGNLEVISSKQPSDMGGKLDFCRLRS